MLADRSATAANPSQTLPITYQLDIYLETGGKGSEEISDRQYLASYRDAQRPRFKISAAQLRPSHQTDRRSAYSYALLIYARNERGNSSAVEQELTFEVERSLNRIGNFSLANEQTISDSSLDSLHVPLLLGGALISVLLVVTVLASQLKFKCICSRRTGGQLARSSRKSAGQETDGGQDGGSVVANGNCTQLAIGLEQLADPFGQCQADSDYDYHHHKAVMYGSCDQSLHVNNDDLYLNGDNQLMMKLSRHDQVMSDAMCPDIIQLSSDSLHVVIGK